MRIFQQLLLLIPEDESHCCNPKTKSSQYHYNNINRVNRAKVRISFKRSNCLQNQLTIRQWGFPALRAEINKCCLMIGPKQMPQLFQPIVSTYAVNFRCTTFYDDFSHKLLSIDFYECKIAQNAIF